MSEHAEGRIPIERWWPRLSIDARHRVLEAMEGDGELDAIVIAEITEAVGADASAPVPGHLNEHERGYIRTQMEAVD
ncbi:hypothetical protein ACDF64_06355 [Agromyces sp. MMS24-JH15]|uniref:hypothetical protein n=1 Tax=Agromyces sp. MMS24-JH15 TaxID=3243765 RepID=UPI0037493E60